MLPYLSFCSETSECVASAKQSANDYVVSLGSESCPLPKAFFKTSWGACTSSPLAVSPSGGPSASPPSGPHNTQAGVIVSDANAGVIAWGVVGIIVGAQLFEAYSQIVSKIISLHFLHVGLLLLSIGLWTIRGRLHRCNRAGSFKATEDSGLLMTTRTDSGVDSDPQ